MSGPPRPLPAPAVIARVFGSGRATGQGVALAKRPPGSKAEDLARDAAEAWAEDRADAVERASMEASGGAPPTPSQSA